MTALAPILTPHGRLRLEPADEAVALSSDLSHRLQKAFARVLDMGSCSSARPRWGPCYRPSSDTGAWARYVGNRIWTRVAHTRSLGPHRSTSSRSWRRPRRPCYRCQRLARSELCAIGCAINRRAHSGVRSRRDEDAATARRGAHGTRGSTNGDTRPPASSDVKRAAISERMKKYWRERRRRER
jgi:hypothetical protein